MPQAGSTRIVFASNRDGNSEIYSMNADGSSLVRLTNNAANDDHARWSPNGTKILFQSDRDNPETGNQDIYVMNADGTGQTRLTTDAADDCNAMWSPDGNKITFQSLRNGNYYQVYTMNADGTAKTNLSNGVAVDYQPSWSPNGSKIAFASERDHAGSPSIYSMNTNGSNQSRLTFSSELARDEQPVWSPDTSKIAFVSTRDGNKNIYLMNANGSNQVQLTNTLENDDAPCWSTDGTKLVFRSERERDAYDPIQQLWSMNADGTNQALISSSDFGDYSPSWSTNASGNQSPVANSGGPYSGVIAQNVPFNGGGSFDPDGTISSYAWSFGDGGTGSGASPTHTYASAGTYSVSLTVTDNLGAQTANNTTTTITTAGAEQYLANFNLSALARQPNTNESSYWNDILRAAYPNGQSSMLLAARELGKTLFESSEYTARNRSNHWYVYDLYKTYLMRDPDMSGWAFWENECSLSGREQVRRAFDECGEFAGIVATLTPTGSPSADVSSLASARVDPFNQPGNGLTSRDAEWSVSLLSLPGRAGLDFGLSLSYSSMLWTRSGPYIYFDEDNGWPSPGFHLGFPRIQAKVFDAQAGRNVYLLISGGSRVSLRQMGTSNIYEAADSSYLQVIDYGGNLLLRTTDGTQLSYQVYNNEWHCTQIKDRNGNYLTVNYDWLGHITTIMDALARTITFNYDSNANLLSITQPWTVNGVQTTHTWATFGWTTKTISPSFSSVMVVGANPSTIPVISQVGLDDGTHYTFEYNAAGQVNPIRSYRSDNVQRAYTAYDYDSPADDCPRLIDTHTWAENWTGINGVPQEVATDYGVSGDGSHTITSPDGSLYKEFYGTGYKRGLVTQTEVWSGSVRQKWTANSWTQDNTGASYQTNPRVTETDAYDAGGNRRRVTTTYGPFTLPSGASCPLPTDTREYAADGTNVLRHSQVDYRMDPILDSAYLDRHIIGLVKEQRLYEVSGDSETLMSKVGMNYDETNSIQGSDAPVRHDDDNYGGSFVSGRGNLSSVKRYDVTDISQFTLSSMKYNTAGAVVSSKDGLNHGGTISYADSFSDGNNSRNTLAYPKTVTDANGYSSTLIYNFDFGGVTSKQTPQPNTIQNIPGPIQTIAYDSAARIERVTATTNGAYTRYVYGPNYVQTLATVNNLADEVYAASFFDGVGRVFAATSNHPGSVGGHSVQLTIHDALGRAIKQSNPTEINASWVPAGDDAAGWFYTQQTYDWKGRPLRTTNTDGTYKDASYSGCGCAGGEVVTLTDEGTIDPVDGTAKRRQQRIYSDVLGRTIKSEILNWQGGSPYATTINNYNARDQVMRSRQFDSAQGTVPSDLNDLSCPNGSCQQTTLTYDGHGRLKTKHAPEQDEGAATTWSYNADDTLSSVVDARSSLSIFTHNARRLVTHVAYEPASGVQDTPDVTFSYDAAGNRMLMSDGLGSVTFVYDQVSRLTSETRSLTGIGTFPLSYVYNLANELISVTDSFNAQVGYNHDAAGRLNNVSGSGYGNVSTYSSNVQYRAWGAIKGLTFGNNLSLSATYNSQMQISQFELAGRPPAYGPSTVMKTQADYYGDGALKFAHQLIGEEEKFDREFAYDHVSTVKEAYSGSEARDFIYGTNSNMQSGPFRQTYQHDAFANITTTANRYWSYNDNFAASYTNQRRQGFQYDAEGNLVQDNDLQYAFDAGGQTVSIQSIGIDSRTIASAYDGAGQIVQRTESQSGTTTSVTYYVRSTAMGGKIITELNQNGQKQKGYVFAGDEMLAHQENGLVRWHHENPLTGASGISGGEGWYSTEVEPDANGVNVGFEDPYLSGCCIFPPPDDQFQASLLGSFRPGKCRLDGMAIDCADAMDMMSIGLIAMCPNNDCGPRHKNGGWEVWNPTTGWLKTGPNKKNPPKLKSQTPQARAQNKKRAKEHGRNPDGVGYDEIQPFDKGGIIAVVTQAFAITECREFANTILAAVSQKRATYPAGGNIADIFNAFLNQKPHALFTRQMPNGSMGYGNPIGHIKAGSAQIYSSPAEGLQTLFDANAVISELFHLAAANDYYTDKELASALNNSQYAREADSVIAPEMNPFDHRYKGKPDWTESNESAYSHYFHGIQENLCHVLPGTHVVR